MPYDFESNQKTGITIQVLITCPKCGETYNACIKNACPSCGKTINWAIAQNNTLDPIRKFISAVHKWTIGGTTHYVDDFWTENRIECLYCGEQWIDGSDEVHSDTCICNKEYIDKLLSILK